MIKVEPCKGCGGVLLVDRFMGVVVRCDPTPVDAQTAGRALIASVPLYRVHALGGRPSSFGSASTAVLTALRGEPSERPMVVPEHRCTKNGSTAPQSPVQGVGDTRAPKVPQRPPVAPSRPSSGPSTATPPAPSAVTPASEAAPVGVMTFDVDPRNPRCKRCGQRCAQGTYAAIELGELLVWAEHIDECEKRNSA